MPQFWVEKRRNKGRGGCQKKELKFWGEERGYVEGEKFRICVMGDKLSC